MMTDDDDDDDLARGGRTMVRTMTDDGANAMIAGGWRGR